MSKENAIALVTSQLPADLQKLIKASAARDNQVLAGSTRYPKLKVAHSAQSFSLPNGDPVKKLECWVVSAAKFMEYYPKVEGHNDEEAHAPECAAVGNLIGSKYGPCIECEHYKWKTTAADKSYRECSSSYRLLLVVKGVPHPVELKVPQTSVKAFETATSDAKLKYGKECPLAFMTLTITLTAKKEGSREWSLMEFDFTMDPTEQGFAKKITDRIVYQKDLLNYFEETYGAMNAAAASKANKDSNGTAQASEQTDKKTDSLLSAEKAAKEAIEDGSETASKESASFAELDDVAF